MRGCFQNADFLSPDDLALCQRVFDQICAEAHWERSGIDSEILASRILANFQQGVTEELMLAAKVRARVLTDG